jgi:ubiquinone biosynthesis accessory factor UbiJ
VAFVFSLMAFEPPFAAALNHLLAAEPWARKRLAAFAESILELRPSALPPMRLAITSDGHLRPAPLGEPASLVLKFGPEAVPAMLKGEDHLLRAVHTEGDSRLASEVLFLVRYLRWDAEEDLSKVLGDAAAHRVAAGARDFFDSQRQALARTAESLADYLLEERRLVTHAAAFEDHRLAVAQLRDAIERLEKRVDRLAG